MHLLELQEDSSVATYCVKIAQHFASMQEYEVRGDVDKDVLDASRRWFS